MTSNRVCGVIFSEAGELDGGAGAWPNAPCPGLTHTPASSNAASPYNGNLWRVIKNPVWADYKPVGTRIGCQFDESETSVAMAARSCDAPPKEGKGISGATATINRPSATASVPGALASMP